MIYGLNPILPAYPAAGESWAAKSPSRDFSVFGVDGHDDDRRDPARQGAGRHVQRARRPQHAHAGRATLRLGQRTSYFVAGKGLVKLSNPGSSLENRRRLVSRSRPWWVRLTRVGRTARWNARR